jgi:hypothetical protein
MGRIEGVYIRQSGETAMPVLAVLNSANDPRLSRTPARSGRHHPLVGSV